MVLARGRAGALLGVVAAAPPAALRGVAGALSSLFEAEGLLVAVAVESGASFSSEGFGDMIYHLSGKPSQLGRGAPCTFVPSQVGVGVIGSGEHAAARLVDGRFNE